MDKKSKFLTIIFAIIVLCSVAVTFYRYVIRENINFYVDEEAFQESLLEE